MTVFCADLAGWANFVKKYSTFCRESFLRTGDKLAAPFSQRSRPFSTSREQCQRVNRHTLGGHEWIRREIPFREADFCTFHSQRRKSDPEIRYFVIDFRKETLGKKALTFSPRNTLKRSPGFIPNAVLSPLSFLEHSNWVQTQ